MNNDVSTKENRDVREETRRDGGRRYIRPLGNIWEENDAVHLRLEMPGVSRDGLEITIDGDSLIIVGKRNAYADDVRYIIHERRDADYRAVYTLDERIDRDKVDAKIENGVLMVTLNLKAEVKPRRIEVTVA